MVDVIKYGNLKGIGKVKKKTQIVLSHTSREAEEYLASLKFRYNGKYNKIPHYLIKYDGEILQVLNNLSYSNFFVDEEVSKQSIVIVLENLGWLDKKPLSEEFINWKGSIYRGKPYEKRWRDFFFWEPYKEIQIENLKLLCDRICEENSIPKKSTGHNTKIDGLSSFEGIVSRSNYDQRFTDLNPSFDFEIFEKHFENEQIPR